MWDSKRLLHSLQPVSGKGARLTPGIAEQNKKAGFVSLSLVAEHYKIDRGVVIEEGKITRQYAPAVDPSLVDGLAAIYTGADIIEFSSTFGLLGYSALVPPERRVGGDPVKWIRAHAHTIYVALSLIGELERIEEGYGLSDLKKYLRTLSSGPYAFAERVIPAQIVGTVHWPNDPIGAAHYILRLFVNRNIQGVQRSLREVSQGFSKSFFTFRATIEAAYWKLADLLERGQVRRCEECGRFFPAKDKRQRYCPKAPGRKRSRCASRFTVRAFRARPPKHKTTKKQRRGK